VFRVLHAPQSTLHKKYGTLVCMYVVLLAA
jgi:hypothetical protein